MIKADNYLLLHDFNEIAAKYDKWYESKAGILFDRLEKRAMLRLIGRVKQEDTLLEVGSGTGWWSSFFSEKGFEVTGIDISPKMVEAAYSKGIPNATFELGDAHALPFPDGCFSATAAITTLEFTHEPERVIQEMVRCTVRPGGKVFLGILNQSAPINQERTKKKRSPFSKARFFSKDEISAILSPHGKITLRSCAFPLSIRLPLPFAYWADILAAWMGRKNAAFTAVRISL